MRRVILGMMLNQELTNQIKELFATQLIYPIMVLYFFRKNGCDTCDETSQLLDEITSLSDKLQITKYDLDENPAVAQKYNVQLTPGLVVAAGRTGELTDYGIRFAGIPSGYELGSLIHSIIMVSKRDSGLNPDVRDQLRDLKKPVQLQVFVTPT